MKQMSSFMRIVRAIFLLAVFLTDARIAAASDKKAPPIPPEKFVGVWSGFSSDGFTFTRLELDADGTGYCARAAVFGNDIHAYRVTSWRLEVFELTIQMSDGKRVLQLKTQARSLLSLALQFDEGHRKQNSFLYPQASLTASDQATQKAIEELKSHAKSTQ